jgi:hypothetical protein
MASRRPGSGVDRRAVARRVADSGGGRRREVGMDDWGFEQLGPWLRAREQMPVGPLFCVIDGRTSRRAWYASAAPGCPAPARRASGGAATLRAASAAARARHRASGRGRAAQCHSAPTRPPKPRRHVDLPPRDRPGRDHPDRSRPPATDDPGRCRDHIAARPTVASHPNSSVDLLALIHKLSTLRRACRGITTGEIGAPALRVRSRPCATSSQASRRPRSR